MMAVLLIGMMVIVPENAQAATQQVKFIDGYNNRPTTDQMINGMVNWYRINLPENWKYTDKDVTIKVSNESVAYLEYEKSEPNGFYLCANYDVPYNTYKPITVTATKQMLQAIKSGNPEMYTDMRFPVCRRKRQYTQELHLSFLIKRSRTERAG